ncbi:hypothetical protein GmHk_19G054351 [Glycine max]|nr:hypothetical protein GmHk_19G054351 [Glycine max]
MKMLLIPHDASSIGACRPRIFFINGFLCFLEDEWQRNGERKRERRRHFKEKMSLEEAHHHRRPWIRAWRKKEMNEGRGREEHEILIASFSEPAPARVEPMPVEPRSPVVNPPPSPEFEVVPPSPPLIIIFDASSDEAVAPPNSPAGETADPPAPLVGGIADLSDSSSREVVSLTDSLV